MNGWACVKTEVCNGFTPVRMQVPGFFFPFSINFCIEHVYQLVNSLIHNHRVTEWVRLEWTRVGLLTQPPCSSKPILEHTAQDCVQILLDYLQWGRLGTLSRQYLPVLGHPHSKVVLPYLYLPLNLPSENADIPALIPVMVGFCTALF